MVSKPYNITFPFVLAGSLLSHNTPETSHHPFQHASIYSIYCNIDKLIQYILHPILACGHFLWLLFKWIQVIYPAMWKIIKATFVIVCYKKGSTTSCEVSLSKSSFTSLPSAFFHFELYTCLEWAVVVVWAKKNSLHSELSQTKAPLLRIVFTHTFLLWASSKSISVSHLRSFAGDAIAPISNWSFLRILISR